MNKESNIQIIPYGRQDINQSDIDAVVEVLNSDFLTQGPIVPIFEQAIADYCAVKYSIAVNSATSALHIACLALGVGRGDLVWTTPITFVASANCAIYCGASVDFIDIDPISYNISIEKLEQKLEMAESGGCLPKVVIPVHFCGQSCDMEGIARLAKRFGFRVIEDASHAIGARYKNYPVGCCEFSDITVFSFHPVKIVTTGEGGIAVTNDSSLAKRLSLFRSHGISSALDDMQLMPSNEIWNYQQIELGFNYRMTDIQAALGLSQIKRLDEFVTRRQLIAKRYDKLLSNLPLQLPMQNEDCYSSFHLYVIRLKLDEINKNQRQIYNEISASGVMINLHYIPVYRQPYYEKLGFSAGYCEHAEQYYHEALTIPMYFGLTDSQQDYVVEKIRKVIDS